MCEDEFMRDPEASPLDMLKVLGDPVRMSILGALTTPRTVKQVGDYLETDASKLYYHVKELYRVGLVDLVETRVVGGVAEKYYLAAKSEIDDEARARMAKLMKEKPDQAADLLRDVVSSLLASVMTEFSWVTNRMREKSGEDDDLSMSILGRFLKLTPEKAKILAGELDRLTKESGEEEVTEGAHRYYLASFLFPIRPETD